MQESCIRIGNQCIDQLPKLRSYSKSTEGLWKLLDSYLKCYSNTLEKLEINRVQLLVDLIVTTIRSGAQSNSNTTEAALEALRVLLSSNKLFCNCMIKNGWDVLDFMQSQAPPAVVLVKGISLLEFLFGNNRTIPI